MALDQFAVLAWDAPGAACRPTRRSHSPSPTGLRYSLRFSTRSGSSARIFSVSRGAVCWLRSFYGLNPARVDRLALADTYTGWKGSLPADVVEKRRARCYRDASRPIDEVVAEWVPVEFFSNASKELSTEMASVVGDFHPVGFRLMAKALADTDTSILLPTVGAPTLLVWGDGDLRSPVSVAEQFHAAIPRSRLEVIAGAGHVSNMEKPDEFNACVRRFLTHASSLPWPSGPPTGV